MQKIEAQKEYPNAYESWIESEDNFLKDYWNDNSNKQTKSEKIQELSKKLRRNEGAINSRIKKLGLE